MALGGGESAAFESSLERDWLELLAFLPEVSALQVQPFTVEYELDGKRHVYKPDVAVLWGHEDNAQMVVYEVKPREELRKWAEYRARFVAATRYCREHGWRFKVINEKHIRTPKLKNVRFLRRYLHLTPDPGVRKHLLATLATTGPSTVCGLLTAAYWSADNQAVALPFLWMLIAELEIVAPLDTPLTMNSTVELRR
ncbi:MAG: TnsA endonuclease N-terminal domain-containing protein [Pseudomonadota bacterium]|nr:TnsA endonuclease N-terminal domain-containing protein [Pseudomonadota bacterium]